MHVLQTSTVEKETQINKLENIIIYCEIYEKAFIKLNLSLCIPFITDNIYKLINIICIDSIPENYFFDLEENLYKLCYKTCIKCNKSGNETIHNCNECIDNYIFFNDSSTYSNNCYDYNQIIMNKSEYEIITQTQFNINLLSNSSFNYLDEAIKNFQEKIMNEFDTITIENGEDFFMSFGKMNYALTTTKNQKMHMNDNITTIDLGECEIKLKEKYNISMNESLYILKIDILVEYIKKIEYEVYYNFSSNKLTKLNLTVCKGIKIDILIPKDIPINEIDKYNKSSGFYNDICYTYTSEFDTDESLKDRRNDYNNKNLSICEEGCDFTEYNSVTKKVKCSCFTKINLPLISEIKLDKQKLISNFKDIRNVGNFLV